MAELDSLISVDWLAQHGHKDDLIIVDATLPPPGATEFSEIRQFIPHAVEFDLLGLKKLDENAQTPELIAGMLTDIGVESSHHIVVYDRRGLFSAPRLWWILRTLGHEKLSILDGGLPAWVREGLKTSNTPRTLKTTIPYTPRSSSHKGVRLQAVLSAIKEGPQIVDARSDGRFNGTAPEPRPGLRSGHIPGSCSLPFGSISDSKGLMHPKGKLAEMIGEAGIDLSRPIITTCGSGVTAAGLAFAFHLLGKDDVSVYSGSWAEWGAMDSGLPIEV